MAEGNMLLKRMIELGMSKQQLSDKSGVPYMTVSNILKKGPEKAGMKNVLAMCAALGVDANDLVADLPFSSEVTEGHNEEESGVQIYRVKNTIPIKKKRIPLLGEIAAGIPIYAEEEHDVYVSIDEDVKCDFALRVKGDSMIGAHIHNGDVVFIRLQPNVRDGQIAAISIDDEATLKRVYHTRDGVTLVSENPDFPPMAYHEDDDVNVRIMGLAVALYHKLV